MNIYSAKCELKNPPAVAWSAVLVETLVVGALVMLVAFVV